MADPLREEVGELVQSLRQFVALWNRDIDEKVVMEGRIKALEIWVRVIIGVNVAIGLGVLGLIMNAIGKVFGGQ